MKSGDGVLGRSYGFVYAETARPGRSLPPERPGRSVGRPFGLTANSDASFNREGITRLQTATHGRPPRTWPPRRVANSTGVSGPRARVGRSHHHFFVHQGHQSQVNLRDQLPQILTTRPSVALGQEQNAMLAIYPRFLFGRDPLNKLGSRMLEFGLHSSQ